MEKRAWNIRNAAAPDDLDAEKRALEAERHADLIRRHAQDEDSPQHRAWEAELLADDIRMHAAPGDKAAERRARKFEQRAARIRELLPDAGGACVGNSDTEDHRGDPGASRDERNEDEMDAGSDDPEQPPAERDDLAGNSAGDGTLSHQSFESDQQEIRIRELVHDIFTSPDIRAIQLTDPRFRWVVTAFDATPGAHRMLGEIVDATVARSNISREAIAQALDHLRLYLAEQKHLSLEDELFSILATLLSDLSKLPALLARMGWHGAGAVTLQAAADQADVSRERIRQIQGKLEQQLLRTQTWTPVLERALNIVATRLPMNESQLGPLLQHAGIANSATFSVDGLLKAAALCHHPVHFSVKVEGSSRWLVAAGEAGQLAHVPIVASAARKAISRYGIVPIDQLILSVRENEPDVMHDVDDATVLVCLETMDHVTILHKRWLVHPDLDVRNPLVNRLNKLLSVWNPIPISWAVRQLHRERRENRYLSIDEDALRAFIRFRPEYSVTGDNTILMEHAPDPNEALSDSERALRHRILSDGGVSTFADLCDSAEAIGTTRVTTAVTLKYSPVFYKLARNEHRTIGPDIDPGRISLEDLLEDDEEEIENQAVLGTEEIQELLDGTVAQPPEGAGSTATRPMQTVSERDASRLRRSLKSQLKARPLRPLDQVLEYHNTLYRETTRDALLEVVLASEEYSLVAETWVTTTPSVVPSPISEALRKLLVWVSPLPVDIAIRQLQRAHASGIDLTEQQLQAFIEIDDEFTLKDGHIQWEEPVPIEEVLSPMEMALGTLLGDQSGPLTLGALRTRFGRGGEASALPELLSTSVLFEDIGRRRYVLFAPDYRAARPEQGKADEPEALPNPEPIGPGRGPEAEERAQEEREETSADTLTTDGDRPALLQPSVTGSLRTMTASFTDLIGMTHAGRLQLPEIQREYVWTPAQVVKLFDSMYRSYPIGSMLIWDTSEAVTARSFASHSLDGHRGDASFLLDGQQRLTSVLNVTRSNTPDLRFNPFTEEFRVATATMKKQPHWLSVHLLLTRSSNTILRESGLVDHPEIEEIERRVDRLKGVLSAPLTVNQLSGFDYEEVSDIFVRVNSQGTRLKTAELAVANLAFQLPGLVSNDIAHLHEDLANRGWDIPTLVILRMLNAVATGQSRFGNLARLDRETIAEAWPRTAEAVPAVLDLIERHLGVESSEWLPSLNALVVPVAWHAGDRRGEIDERSVMNWFVHASVFGRYTGPTETNLNQDLRALREARQPFGRMTALLRSSVGRFRVTLGDMEGATWNTSWSLLYWLTLRRLRAADLWTGARLGSSHLGGRTALTRHQIFMRKRGSRDITSSMVNELANLVLLAQAPDDAAAALLPEHAFAEMPEQWLDAQCVPTDPVLWTEASARRFIETRRRLLVREMGETLNALG